MSCHLKKFETEQMYRTLFSTLCLDSRLRRCLQLPVRLQLGGTIRLQPVAVHLSEKMDGMIEYVSGR